MHPVIVLISTNCIYIFMTTATHYIMLTPKCFDIPVSSSESFKNFGSLLHVSTSLYHPQGASKSLVHSYMFRHPCILTKLQKFWFIPTCSDIRVSSWGGLSPICAATPWQNALTGRSKEAGQLWKPSSVWGGSSYEAANVLFFSKLLTLWRTSNMQHTNIPSQWQSFDHF